MSKKLYLIDGSGFIFRAFYALPPLTRPDGLNVGAVFGFCNILLKLQQSMIESHEENYLAVIFDMGRKTFRQDIYKDYKAQRPEAPEELVPQFPLFRQACQAFQIPALGVENYEADDLIATYTEAGRKEGIEVVIVSSDKDLMQLIAPGISMYDPIKSVVIDAEKVFEKFGVTPEKVVDILALAGDASDNIPGVPGIGPKTAALLINEFGSLEALLDNLDKIPQPKRKQLLIDNKELALLSKQLVTLHHQVPLPQELNALLMKKPAFAPLSQFLESQGFKKILTRLKADYFQDGDSISKESMSKTDTEVTTDLEGVRSGPLPSQEAFSLGTPPKPLETLRSHEPIKQDYSTITTLKELEAWVKKALQLDAIAIDTETTSLNPIEAQLVGISLALQPGQACYIPLQHKHLTSQIAFDDMFAPPKEKEDQEKNVDDVANQLPLNQVLEILTPLLLAPNVIKIGHNIKYDLAVLKKYNVQLTPIHDTMLMSYVLEASLHGHGLDELAKLYFDHEMITYKEVTGTGKKQITFDYVPISKATLYAAEDADYTLRLYRALKPQLVKSSANSVYEYAERPLVPILVDMESKGIKVDLSILDQLSSDFTKRILTLEESIYKLAGETFNIGSPKQLGEILFEKLSLPTARKTKTGGFSTDADTLEDLAFQGFEVAEEILQWRGLSKLKSTYIEGLSKSINPKTGRVHTSYSMAGTSTGRLASSDPNLQNIPIRSDDGRKIRKAFISDAGKVLLSLDYSQIELRLLAHVANIPELIHAFKEGADIHKVTASQLFEVPLDQVNVDQRRQAKTINFGIIYGISAFGLSQQLKIPTSMAQEYIKAYLRRYPGIEQYMEKMKFYARNHGYVLTPWDRMCHTPDINSQNPVRRQAAERQAINAPLQGGNADIIKRAMIKLYDSNILNELKADLLLQVHDELIFEVPEDMVEEAGQKIKTIMENIVHLSVPLVVDAGWAKNWGDIK